MAKKKLVDVESLNESNVLEFARAIGNYRSQDIDTQLQKKWIVEAGNKLKIAGCEVILDIPDNWYIDTWGYVSRMFNLGFIKELSNISQLNVAINNMVIKMKTLEEETKSKQSPMEIVKSQVEDFLHTVTPVLNNPDFDIVNAALVSTLSNTHIKQLINIMDDCVHKENLIAYLEKNKPKEKRTRKKKVTTKEDKCKLFNCLSKFEDIEGCTPEDIINATCVVVYHTQKKLITFYHGKKLDVHRSMIVGFDKELSGEYKLKDKEHLSAKGKARIIGVSNVYAGEIKAEPTGRVTDKMIIIGVC